MRLVSLIADGVPTAGVLVGEEVVPAAALGAPASARALLSTLDAAELRELARRAAGSPAPRTALAGASLAAPVPDPQKIICMGLNYRDHAEETGQEIPQAPMWFAKFQNSLCGSGEEIVLPAAHPDYVDYEAELALVIGRGGHAIPEADAVAHVAGVMPFNDVSARDLQLQNPLWTSGKAIDTFAPCGPALVTLDELEDLDGLVLRTRVNGEQLQQGTTANLIFGAAELVSWLSRTMTLLPGDIIATGTPAGVGAAQGRFLRDGDTVEVEVEGVGTVANPVRAE
ncbi:MAG TPA: fumarylacetoacetate hydrolase family protein [Solirubrobacteraceae bacterium]|nr:fumarylacetoacetate hydrolase family protein [Solirubrobacteraceae bacterium]